VDELTNEYSLSRQSVIRQTQLCFEIHSMIFKYLGLHVSALLMLSSDPSLHDIC
jgi:hypothetical protein